MGKRVTINSKHIVIFSTILFYVCLQDMQTVTSLSVEGIVHIMLYGAEALKLAVVHWT